MKHLISLLRSIAPALVIFAVIKVAMMLYAPPRVSTAELNQALSAPSPVLLEFHASWCSTCLIQRNVLNSVMAAPEFSGIKRFMLNYDLETELKERFGVVSQSTLLLVKNGGEVSRSVGETSSDGLRRFLSSVVFR